MQVAPLSPTQPSQFAYHAHPPPPTTQSTYQSNGIHQNGGTSSSPAFSNGHSNGSTMNPYQQQQQQLPPQHQQQQPAQYGNPSYAQYAAQQPQLQSNPQQSQQVHRPYLQQQTQLPPLVPGMGPAMGGIPVAKDDPSMNASGSANAAQSAYIPVLSQSYVHSLPQQTLPASVPQAIAGASNPPQDRQLTHSSVRDGLRFALEVIQQPQRARMCGFGDKDRRPITPPPCVRLVITDEATGREIDVEELTSDASFFVLQVDLWSEHADREANVVRASSTSPAVSISSATTTSYPPPSERPLVPTAEPRIMVAPDGQTVIMPGYAVPMGMPSMPVGQYGAPSYYPTMPPVANTQFFTPPTQSSNPMYTRNLIGSLTVNAAKLTDNDGKTGHWFVLQDLSVRTEGFFRLRMSFIDISAQGAPGLNRGRAAILAWTFSDPFQVYSAKKFPGVIESTPLSKCFASQGIKIPIRKDNKNDAQDDDDDGD